MKESPSLHHFHTVLLDWFNSSGRSLPWRDLYSSATLLRDPYRILISELMLQQTQVARVVPKFEAFIERWPTVGDLAEAQLRDVLDMWQGLGYNRRAKYLLLAAQEIHDHYDDVFPTDREKLQSLPGIGTYTASAICVFAFNQHLAVVDTNIRRVLTRVESGITSLSDAQLTEIAVRDIPEDKADSWHQALMDFGATVCSAKFPQCTQCCLKNICIANREAIELGYGSMQDYLSVHPKVRKQSGKDHGKRFEQTDRYFRGRIIDYLRLREVPMSELQTYMLVEHKVPSLSQFGQIIETLVLEKLIHIDGNIVRLG